MKDMDALQIKDDLGQQWIFYPATIQPRIDKEKFEQHKFKSANEPLKFLDGFSRENQIKVAQLSEEPASKKSELARLLYLQKINAFKPKNTSLFGATYIPTSKRDAAPAADVVNVSPDPQPAPAQEEDPLCYKVVVEMAGKANRDRISLGIRADAEQSFADFTATPQVDTTKGHRSLAVMDNVEQTPYELYMQIPMSGADPLQLSLDTAVQPVEETTEKDEWDNVLVPIKPLAYMTEDYSRDKSALLAKGYVYIFWQDKLWRELEVTKRTGFKDTNVLAIISKGDADTSGTAPRSGISPEHSYLWMPYKIGGAVQSDVQIGYSRRSWTLDKITELEGDAGKRDELTTTIDLSVYSQQQDFNAGLQGQPGDVEPIKTLLTTQMAADEDQDNSFARDEAPLSSDRYAGIPGVYLSGEGKYLEIELVDEDDLPQSGAKYQVFDLYNVLIKEGALDENGYARVMGVEEENANVVFPEYDQSGIYDKAKGEAA